MTEYRVPVKSWLKATTYRTLSDYAKAHDIPDVGTLLEQLAERSVTPRPTTRRTWIRMTPERLDELVKLHGEGMTTIAIAARIGVSPASVYNHGRRLGLEWKARP